MKDTLEILGSLLALVALRVAAFAWLVLKLAVLAAILVGAGTEVINNAPQIWPPFEFSLDVLLAYAVGAFDTALNSWIVIGLALLVIWMWSTRGDLKQLTSDATQTKIAVVALMNYLEIGVETEGMKALQEKGVRGIWQRAKENLVVSMILGQGMVVDDALTAKPVRHGASASLADDLNRQLKASETRL